MKSGISLNKKKEQDQWDSVCDPGVRPLKYWNHNTTEVTCEEWLKWLLLWVTNTFWNYLSLIFYILHLFHKDKSTVALTVRDSLLRPLVTKLKPWVSIATPVRWMCSSTYLTEKDGRNIFVSKSVRSTVQSNQFKLNYSVKILTDARIHSKML